MPGRKHGCVLCGGFGSGMPRNGSQKAVAEEGRSGSPRKCGAGAILLLLVLCSHSQAGWTEEDPRASLTIHALNGLTGRPAAGLPMRLSELEAPNKPWIEILKSATNSEGCLDKSSLAPQRLKAGTYKLHFDTGEYWRQQGHTSFYPYVEIVFTITEAERRVHLPLLLSPCSYTTYRGS
uniref:hydroxyisourate hydrolase n=1 Tax=Pogona vitticeps TaxID=103695 RepID=A0A6J0T969_9SAUR